ncbi:hypothetical protein LDENG_00122410 [Lucifuga dentata]|nr:hypothetical protein LDENG_00122410 [Lucifuga dentata]
MPWSPHVSITAMPSSVVFLINSLIVSELSRTLLPGSSPTPNHLTTSPPSSQNFFIPTHPPVHCDLPQLFYSQFHPSDSAPWLPELSAALHPDSGTLFHYTSVSWTLSHNSNHRLKHTCSNWPTLCKLLHVLCFILFCLHCFKCF